MDDKLTSNAGNVLHRLTASAIFRRISITDAQVLVRRMQSHTFFNRIQNLQLKCSRQSRTGLDQ